MLGRSSAFLCNYEIMESLIVILLQIYSCIWCERLFKIDQDLMKL